MEPIRSHDIDGTAEFFLEIQTQPGKIEERAAWFEFDKKVQIASGAVVTARHGTEDRGMDNPSAPKRR